MNLDTIIERVLTGTPITKKEAGLIYRYMPTAALMQLAHHVRIQKKGDSFVSWIIDRNVNISNVCVSGCKFCSFQERRLIFNSRKLTGLLDALSEHVLHNLQQ